MAEGSVKAKRRNVSSSASAEQSVEEGPSSYSQLKLQRDTLYVNESSGETTGEWIVSYNSSSGPEARHANRDGSVASSTEGKGGTLCDDIDMSQWSGSSEPFNLVRVIASKFMSSVGTQRPLRLFCCLDKSGPLLGALYGILLASNIINLSVHVSKLSKQGGELVLVIRPMDAGTGRESHVVRSIDAGIDETSLVSHLISEMFACVFTQRKDSVLQIHTERLLLAAVKAVATISFELLTHPTVGGYGLGFCLESSTVDPGVACMNLTVALQPLSAVETADLSTFLRSPSDCRGFLPRLTAVDGLVGSVVPLMIDVGAFFVVESTNAVLRLLMAGYCCVRFLGDSSLVNFRDLYELVLIVNKFFALTLVLAGSGLELTRKSCTIDPYARKEGKMKKIDSSCILEQFLKRREAWAETRATEIPVESSTGLVGGVVVEGRAHNSLIAHSAPPLQFQTPASCPPDYTAYISIPRSADSLLEAVGRTELLVPGCRYSLTTEGDSVRVECVAPSTVDWVLAESQFVTQPDPPLIEPTLPGDVSPSNYLPVDLTVKLEEEAKIFEARLENISVDDARRLSVLLVGPRVIGKAVRIVAQTADRLSPKAALEFVSERAVRDSSGSNLKCAVRLFIKRTLGIEGLDEMLRSACRIEIHESDSRITIAQNLFGKLNQVPNKAPYVVMEAKGDHCAFVGAMSIVVANGWSRAIQQRVETRVVIGGHGGDVVSHIDASPLTTVLFVTRLVVNTVIL